MKTKTKTLVLAEIAIVLCSLFFVALPAIAADQNQTAQKVSANTITTTADRPTYEHTDLDVFGNANEDDTIDMRDTTYIKLVIFGKKPETDLADANYDGKVSMLDVGQTKLIILGKEKKLTYIDIFGEAETVNKPIKQLVNLGGFGLQVARVVGAMDILLPVVGGDKSKYPIFYPVMSKWPSVGSMWRGDLDFEYILNLKPDAVQTNLEAAFALNQLEQKRDFEEKLPGIPLICLNMREPDVLSKNIRTYGYIIDRKDEAEEFIDWFEGYYNTIKSRTEELSEDEKPRSYFEIQHKYKGVASGSRFGQTLLLAGGKNIVDEIVGPDDLQYGTITVEVDPEWVITQNPEYIFKRGTVSSYPCSYESDDPSGMIAARQEILNRPELANVDAVKNGRVCVLDNSLISGGGSSPIGAAYMGKVLQPELFEDIDPQEIHQEYVDRFCHINFNVREHGVFVYPPIE